MNRHRRDWGKIGEMMDVIRSRGMTLAEGAKEFGVKVALLYEYNRLRKVRGCVSSGVEGGQSEAFAESKGGDADEEKRGESVVASVCNGTAGLPADLKMLIVSYRRSHPDHGYKRIEEWLKRDHLVVVPRKTIRRVLKSHGLHTSNDSSFDGGQASEGGKGTRRFEAPFAGSLYQMDIAYVYVTGIPVLYLVVIVDDYSRFCVGAELCDRCGCGMMIEVLHRAIERHGKPKRLLTDQGTSFYTWSYEPTQFQRYLDDMHIEHIVGDPHSPQTTGKVERLIQTLRRELLAKRRFESAAAARAGLREYIESYNHGRGHQSLGGQSPSSRFYGIESETNRIEASLAGKELDFSRGYLVLKSCGHTISVTQSSGGVAVYLDGQLLRKDCGDESGSCEAP